MEYGDGDSSIPTRTNYFIHTKSLITLCKIIDDFEQFEKKLKSVMSVKYNYDFVIQLMKLSRGKFFIGGTKAKKFYNENKDILNTISKYGYIYDFILSYWDGDLMYFYNYILNHKDNLDNILAVLEKIDAIGFSYIEFNNNLDFTNEIHEFDVNPGWSKVIYLDNLVAIPKYYSSVIHYKTSNSNYKIIVEKSYNKISKEKIILNDLTFDSNRLPNAITKEEIFDKIIALKDEKQQEYSQISDSVNLSVGIHDLYEIFNKINSKINNTENVERKEELIELLHNIKDAISKMQSISDEYNKQISSTSDYISEELLSSEKDAYIRARHMSSIDFC